MLLSQDFDENADKLLVFFIAILIIIYISIFNDRTHISVLLNSKVKAEEGVVDTDTYSQGKAKFHYLLIDDRKFLLSEKVYVGIKEGLLARIYYLKDDIFLGIEYLEKLA